MLFAERLEPAGARLLTSEGDGGVTGQVVNLPASISKKLDITTTLIIRHNHLLYNIPPHCMVPSGRSVRVILPAGTLPDVLMRNNARSLNPISFTSGKIGTNSVTMASMLDDDDDDDSGNDSADDMITVTQAPPSTGSSSRGRKKRYSRPALSPPRSNENSNDSTSVAVVAGNKGPCSFQSLHAGFDCMSEIFKRLKLLDLMR